MAKYFEKNGRLVPVDGAGKEKKGRVFGVAMGSSRKPFAESLRERMEEEQAGGAGDGLGTGAQAATPPATSSIRITCERCGLGFSSIALAQHHVCERKVAASGEPETAPVDSGAEAGKNPAPSPTRTCELEGCNESLEGQHHKTRYCCAKHKRRAAYLRGKK